MLGPVAQGRNARVLRRVEGYATLAGVVGLAAWVGASAPTATGSTAAAPSGAPVPDPLGVVASAGAAAPGSRSTCDGPPIRGLGLGDFDLVPRTEGVAQIGPLGHSDARVDLVILGDGYPARHLRPDGAFWADAVRATRALFDVEAFGRHRDRFNVHVVTPGAVATPDGGPDADLEPVRLLDCRAGAHGIERLIGIGNLDAADSFARWVGGVECVLVLVNDGRPLGSALCGRDLPYACCSSRLSDTRVVAHEVGHALAGLGDEYVDLEVQRLQPLPRYRDLPEPNLTLARVVDRTDEGSLGRTLKWSGLAWERFGTSWARQACVMGGYYRAFDVFRPATACIMRDSWDTREFCFVCADAIERAIERRTGDPIRPDGATGAMPARAR